MKTLISALFSAICLAVAPRLCSQQPMNRTAMDTACTSGGIDHASMDHASMAGHSISMSGCGALPTLPAQAAYGAIKEVVALLKADPSTDWSKVNLEALRQHMIDMDDVEMRSTVAQANVPGGLRMNITGEGRTVGAIKRMVGSHAMMLSQDAQYAATVEELPNGERLTVTARDPSNANLVAMIRGLGFAGLITEGDHHAKHHLAVARGEASMTGH